MERRWQWKLERTRGEVHRKQASHGTQTVKVGQKVTVTQRRKSRNRIHSKSRVRTREQGARSNRVTNQQERQAVGQARKGQQMSS